MPSVAPSSARLELGDQQAAPGATVTFTALGPDGALLEAARWRVNGQWVATRGPRLALGPLSPDQDGTVVDFQAGALVSRVALLCVAGEGGHPSARWTSTVKGLLQAPRARVGKGGTVFCGSSTVAMWDLDRCFPGRAFANRGFGGSTLRDLLHHSADLLLKARPARVVLYGGDNDLAQGVAPEALVETYHRLKLRLQGSLPGVRLVVVGIKPSPARLALWPQAQAANALLKERFAEPGCSFVDPAGCLLGPDGRPDPAWFLPDGLHLNAKGYARLSGLLAGALP